MSFAVVVAFVSMLVLLFMRVPVFVSVMGASAAYFILTPGITSRILVQRMIAGSENVALLAIVFFVCAGIFMGCSGVTKRLMNFCDILVGGFVGGLGQVSVLLATLMGGISGSSYADAAMQSKMIVPEMVKRGFSLEFSSVITAMAAIITPLIPPGIALIIYGSIANISIGKLFVAGFGPGILLCILMMIMVSIISHKRNYTHRADHHAGVPQCTSRRNSCSHPSHRHHRRNSSRRLYPDGGRRRCNHVLDCAGTLLSRADMEYLLGGD